MGGSLSNTVNINTEVTNQILQDVNQTCNSTCTAASSGNTIIIAGATVDGSITIQSQCTASAACVMTNTSNASIKNIVDNIVQQEITSVTDMMGDLDIQNLNNTVNINTAINNYITQITTQTCNAVTDVQANDNFIYVGSGPNDGKTILSGDIFISAEGNSSANCTMSNISKIQAYNQSQNSVTQSITSVGMFVALAIVFAIIVLIGGLVYVMMYSKGSFGGAIDPLESGELDPDLVTQLLKGRNVNVNSPPGAVGGGYNIGTKTNNSPSGNITKTVTNTKTPINRKTTPKAAPPLPPRLPPRPPARK